MTPEALRRLLEQVAATAARVGELPDEAEAGPPAGPIFRPVDGRTAGVVADWVTPVAQRWAPELDLEPLELGRVLAQRLVDHHSIDAVEVAPSGLLSLTLADSDRSAIIDVVLEHEATYGLPPGKRVPVVDVDGHRGDLPVWLGSDPALRPAQLAHARLLRLVRNARAAESSSAPPTAARTWVTSPSGSCSSRWRTSRSGWTGTKETAPSRSGPSSTSPPVPMRGTSPSDR